MKRMLIALLSLTLVLMLAGCGSTGEETAPQENEQNQEETAVSITKMKVEVSGETFTATLENNTAVGELVKMMNEGTVTLNLSDYSGFEKVGSLGATLTSENTQMTTQPGDIVLYNSNQIVMFYGSNSWSYTKLAHIDDLTGWEESLGSGDVTVKLSIAK